MLPSSPSLARPDLPDDPRSIFGWPCASSSTNLSTDCCMKYKSRTNEQELVKALNFAHYSFVSHLWISLPTSQVLWTKNTSCLPPKVCRSSIHIEDLLPILTIRATRQKVLLQCTKVLNKGLYMLEGLRLRFSSIKLELFNVSTWQLSPLCDNLWKWLKINRNIWCWICHALFRLCATLLSEKSLVNDVNNVIKNLSNGLSNSIFLC